MTRLPSRLSATCFRINVGRRMLGHRIAMSPNFRRDRSAGFSTTEEEYATGDGPDLGVVVWVP
jgi:hypothetical protein